MRLGDQWDSGSAAFPTYWNLRAMLVALVCVWALVAWGQPAQAGQPLPWQMDMQPAATPLAEQLQWFHTFLLYIITGIVIFVFSLMGYVLLRFNERANPKPSRTTHNTFLEIAWTVVPILILLVIAIPSFRLLFAQYAYPQPDLTIKAIGSQWYWTYEYPDYDNLTFDAVMVEDDKLKPGQPRLLATDNEVVVPVNKNVQVFVTASDVIHNWTVPAFGVKLDGVPGRLQRTWFRAERTGIFYGQCSELCGRRHAFMPIAVRVVSQEEFEQWLIRAKKEFATGPSRAAEVARLEQ